MHAGVGEKEFADRVLRPMRGLCWRLRSYLALDGLAVIAAVVVAAGAVHLLLDWWWRLRVDMRAALLALIAAGLGVLAWRRIVRPWRGAPSSSQPWRMALLVERRFPGLHSVLISAVRFGRGEVGPTEANSPQLVGAVLRQATQQVAGLPLEQVLDHRRARRSAGVVAGLTALVATAFLIAPGTLGLWFDRAVLLADTPWPQRTRLVVESDGGEFRAARGDDLEIRANVPPGYEVPRLVEIVYTTADGRVARDHMVRVGERGYRHTFSRLTEELEFYLQGGDDRTHAYAVRLADRPAVEQVAVTVVPPGYTGLAAYRLPRGQRSVEVLPGSEVRWSVLPSKPIRKATLMSDAGVLAEATPQEPASQPGQGADTPTAGRGNGEGEAATGGGGWNRPYRGGPAVTTWKAAFRPERSQTVYFALVDELGLEGGRDRGGRGAGPMRFAIRVLKDEAPQVGLKLNGAPDMITEAAVLSAAITVGDDFGLATGELVYQLSREGETEHALELANLAPGSKRCETRMDVAAASMTVLPGDRVTLYARAADQDNVNGPNVGSSSALTLRGVTAEELLVELSRQEQQCRRDFEAAIEAQENLRRELLTLAGEAANGQNSAPTPGAQKAATAERRQRQVTASVAGVRQRFERILVQMRVNRLDTEAVRRRLGDGIIAPLTRLERRDLVAAADALRSLASAAPGEVPALMEAIDPQQAKLLADMRAVLDQMLQWEGFQETVTMLREILRLQQELNTETQKEIERQAGDVFKDE